MARKTITQLTVEGMAAGIEIAENNDQIVAIAEKFQETIGRMPSICLGMSFGDAIEALMDSIDDENLITNAAHKVKIVDRDGFEKSIHAGNKAETKPDVGAIESEGRRGNRLDGFDW